MRLRRMTGKPRPPARARVELDNAANGLRPLPRDGYGTVLVFWFGWPTSEVPGLYFSASVLDALRRGRRGDFAGPRGKAALALTAAAWVVLAVIHRRGVTTPGPVLSAALRDGIGDDYADVIATLPPTPSVTGRPSGALRTTVIRRRYVKESDIVRYGPAGPANLADIWRQRDLP